MHKPSDVAAFTALTTASVVWGGSIVGQKFALGSFSAVETSLLRGLGALAILFPLWLWREGRTTAIHGKDWGILALLSLGVLGNHLLTLFGLRYIGAASAGVIIGASPVITALLSSLVLRDIPFSAVWLGCMVSFTGVALVSGIGTDIALGTNPWLGGTLVILGLVSWALYSIGSRRVMDRFSPLLINWTTIFLSVLPQIPLVWMDQKVLAEGFGTVSVGGWVALGYLVVFATALGQQAWLYGVQGIGPSRAGAFLNLIPVSALLLSALVLEEPIGMREVLGISLILAGVWLVNRRIAH